MKTKLQLDEFFGLAIDSDRSDIGYLLEKLGIDRSIEESKVVKSLKRQAGADSSIVSVGRRQQILKLIQPLLVADMLAFEPGFYEKELNTSSQHDRRYSAEDKLLKFALVIASTKSLKVLANDGTSVSAKTLREIQHNPARYDRCWDLLADETNHIVEAFRKSK